MDHPQYSSMVGTHSQPSLDGRWWAKMSLRLLSLISCITILASSAAYYGKETEGALLFMGPPASLAAFWDCIDALRLCLRRGRGGIHPLGCLIFDFVLFLGLVAMSGVIAHTIANLSDSGYYFAYFQDEGSVKYLHISVGFGFFAAIIHLAIFLMSWRALKAHKNPQTQAPPQIIYVRTDAYGNPIGDVNQQYHMAELSSHDPPPDYGLPSYPGASQQGDQVDRGEPMDSKEDGFKHKA